MTLSFVFAWAAVICLFMTAFRYLARISKSKKADHFFHKLHIPVGVLLIAAGLLHGLPAGNFADTGLSDVQNE